ncbi:hypothetical protein GCM10007036_11590 [Alsobacter metallidurans]|uniref:Uncharacterized protein n=1 Tax=Alsobacter metallidurans TaxID=340221 RepID=A0A917MH77_9HYPH|nr:hypothetical protein [Alsobacter metallidurans]GGH13191.1 hypothetical protein GCM10007036_11590 [Alsobacter metallidurans]
MLARFRSAERDQETDAERRKRIRQVLLDTVATLPGSRTEASEGEAEERDFYLRLIAKLDKPL